jgi:NADH-quinone oxidoreductase subunit D
MINQVQYQFHPDNHHLSDPLLTQPEDLKPYEMILNIGPQHPSTHGVLRLEVVTDGEQIVKAIPHLGFLHRCFEKHAENLPYPQIIPFVDRLDYLAAMNNEHIYAMALEHMMGVEKTIPLRTEYIRVLVAELNRLSSHFLGVGAYAMDLGAFTPFLWLLRDREHINRMLEWVSGARMLYNYIWIGGLYYDLPVGFEERCLEFVHYLKPKLLEFKNLLVDSTIFVNRTAGIGVIPLPMALDYALSGPMLRGSGLRYDLRRVDAYSVYPLLDFEIPIGEGKMGKIGDCWDRTYVRMEECNQSIKIIEQCLEQLTKNHKRTRDFDPQASIPKKIRPPKTDYYFRGESPKGELGFFFRHNTNFDIPYRCKVRAPSFCNLSIFTELTEGVLIADLIAILGSIDIVMGEVDR